MLVKCNRIRWAKCVNRLSEEKCIRNLGKRVSFGRQLFRRPRKEHDNKKKTNMK
jgi:hypothetical protein